jgi:hypothetical protein
LPSHNRGCAQEKRLYSRPLITIGLYGDVTMAHSDKVLDLAKLAMQLTQQCVRFSFTRIPTAQHLSEPQRSLVGAFGAGRKRGALSCVYSQSNMQGNMPTTRYVLVKESELQPSKERYNRDRHEADHLYTSLFSLRNKLAFRTKTLEQTT